MTTFLLATNVGDSYRDATGGVSTVVHKDADRTVVRRAGKGRFATYSVFSADMSRVIASCCRSVQDAMSAA